MSDIRVIPNPVPTDVFRPYDKGACRAQLGLPIDHLIVGVGSLNATSDPRKGYRLIVRALEALVRQELPRPTTVLVFGASEVEAGLPFPARSFGTIREETDLARIYAAMDVFVCPSQQENLPNTVAEALSCGTPCVGFKVGGLPELIEHRERGYLADAFDPEDLANGIRVCLDPEANCKLGSRAREFAVSTLSMSTVGRAYAEFYESVLSKSST